jgi:hypothetical protein
MSKLRWNVEIEVAEELVADGLEISEPFIQYLLATAMPYVRASGVRVRVLASPDADEIARAQGFASALDKAARKKLPPDPTGEEPVTARLSPRPGTRVRS